MLQARHLPVALLVASCSSHFPAVHALVQEIEHKVVVETGKCGVTGLFVQKDRRYEERYKEKELDADLCNKMLVTNCSLAYSAPCPDACAYRAPHPIFPCIFTCVSAGNCSATDPNHPFAKPDTKTCTTCSIPLCKQCEEEQQQQPQQRNRQRCIACHPGFDLQDDGSGCVFRLDTFMPSSNAVYLVLAVVIVLVVLFAIIWCACNGQHPHQQKHLKAIARGRRHRHLTKTVCWNTGQEQAREWISVFENMHSGDFLGLGAALFYNNICFILLVALLLYAGTYCLYHGHRGELVAELLQNQEAAWMDTVEGEKSLPDLVPATMVSPLHACGKFKPEHAQQLLRDFARAKCAVLGLLYVILLFVSLAFARFQVFWEGCFDKKHASMSDFTIRLSGLPKDDTDEEGLSVWLQDEFRKAAPGDVWLGRGGMGGVNQPVLDLVQGARVQVHSVSLCYDYLDQKDDVDDALSKMMQIAEARMEGSPDIVDTADGLSLDECEQAQRRRALDWFGEKSPNRLLSTGEAFVIFKRMTDRDKILRAFSRGAQLQHPLGNMPISVHTVHSEPPNRQWWYMGLSGANRKGRLVWFTGKLLLIVLCVQCLTTVPYTYFVLWPYSVTGTGASGFIVTIAGIILGNANWICFLSNFKTAEQIGYRTKDRLYNFVFVSNTLVVFWLVGCNVYTLAHTVRGQTTFTIGPKHYFDMVLSSIGNEMAFARAIHGMLVPGGFFVNMIMIAIMAGPVPFAVNTLISKIIYVWRCFPPCVLRVLKAFLPYAPPTLDRYPTVNAEKGLEPWEVPICGNYADHIVTPTLCIFTLFFASPWVCKIFHGMCLWASFEYCYFRWMHLRYHKTCYYFGSSLEILAGHAWGVPLSVLAAAWCAWAMRAGLLAEGLGPHAKLLLVCSAFFASVALWLLLLTFLVRPWERREVLDDNRNMTVEETQSRSIYSWLNCNPPYVLKCKYFLEQPLEQSLQFRSLRPQVSSAASDGSGLSADRQVVMPPADTGSDNVLPFQVGKQHLFLKSSQRLFIMSKGVASALEYETWLEGVLSIGDTCASHHEQYEEESEEEAREANEKSDDEEQYYNIRFRLNDADDDDEGAWCCSG